MKIYKKKRNLFLLAINLCICALFIGCSNNEKKDAGKIIVLQQSEESDQYDIQKDITDANKVKKVKNILETLHWQDAEISMVNPPNYKFQFASKHESNKSSQSIYDLWISPEKNQLGIVIEGESKYAQLDEDNSKKLFKILTGKNLTD